MPRRSPRWARISAGTEPAAPAVVLVADLAAPADAGLDTALGAAAAQRLRRALVARARRWAADAAADRAWEATSLDAACAVLHAHRHAGPVILAAPDVPRLDAALVADIMDDLTHGVAVTLGASHDGSPYVIGLVRAEDDLFGLVARKSHRDALFAALVQRGVPPGLLRSERRLSSPSDARALAIDPLAPEDLAAELAPAAERLRRGAAR
jgi:Uncharacterized protein conserved in bacteria (DUF2064)